MPKLKNTCTCFGAALLVKAQQQNNRKRKALRNIAVIFIIIKLSKFPPVRILLEIHYLPSIAYFSHILASNEIVIDDTEPFGRQSYRNRCYIAAANGRMPLIIPVKRSRSGISIKDIEIDNHTNWQRIHWQSIQSAYGKSAFFEYYADAIKPFYELPYEKLFDYDLALLKTLIKLLKMKDVNISFLSQLDKDQKVDLLNFKDKIHPKTALNELEKHFSTHPYMQVFEEKNGFIPNLSVLDLLFCEGPNAKEVISDGL
ncbi:MAG: WbqC family protein [Bacteroidia bacterium]